VLRDLSGDAQEQDLVVIYSWQAAGLEPAPRLIPSQDFPWVAERLRREQPVIFARLDELPAEAGRDRDSFHQRGVRSACHIPLVVGARAIGALTFITVTAERTWPDEVVQRLHIVAQVFANVLGRKETEDALRASELMKSSILASLTSSVAVLDRQGQIVAVNDSWARFARQYGVTSDGVGVHYFEVWRRATGSGTPHTAEALDCIEAVLNGPRTECTMEYASQMAAGERWFALSVVRLGRSEGGVVISYTDVTARKQAELAAQRSREELTHYDRVSTIGAMAASLAHEMSQPLTGIMSNAQAARRFMAAMPPALDELRDIVADIVEDVKRAGEFIQRLRDLLRKDVSEHALLNLNTLSQDVMRLVHSDAIIRNVTVTIDCDPQPVIVYGNRVQLQQVILNLVLNAMEAIAEGTGDDRTVTVRIRDNKDRSVYVAVQDSGPGVKDGTQELLFEPFYTTKPTGMGMGLTIVRSIIEAHGGVIWATNNPTCGVTFHFTLPWINGEQHA
jgi:signal transduction histidine kinase